MDRQRLQKSGSDSIANPNTPSCDNEPRCQFQPRNRSPRPSRASSIPSCGARSSTSPGCPIRSHFQEAVAENEGRLEGVSGVAVDFDVLSNEEKGRLQHSLGRQRLPEGALAQVKNIVCVASGKGGVGKSTMTANLAAALQADGQTSGALDCDVYGYSMPRMLGVNRKPEVNAERKIVPLTAPGGIKVMSIGFFLEENAAVVWRGPMLHKAIQQFLEDVDWG